MNPNKTSNEALKLPFIHGRFHLNVGVHVFWVGFESFTIYYAPKEFYLSDKKGAFIWIQKKSRLVKSDKELFKCEYIFLECLCMNQGLCYTLGENLSGRHKAESQECIYSIDHSM